MNNLYFQGAVRVVKSCLTRTLRDTGFQSALAAEASTKSSFHKPEVRSLFELFFNGSKYLRQRDKMCHCKPSYGNDLPNE